MTCKRRKCKQPDCFREDIVGLGYCSPHYQRQRKGTSLAVPVRSRGSAGLLMSHSSPSWFATYLPQPAHCPLCLTGSTTLWCVDHDHTCGRHATKHACAYCVRGILCNRCNCGDIAVFERYPFLLEHPELPARYREYFRVRPILALLEAA